MDGDLFKILEEKSKQVAILEKKISQQSQKAISARNKGSTILSTDEFNISAYFSLNLK